MITLFVKVCHFWPSEFPEPVQCVTALLMSYSSRAGITSRRESITRAVSASAGSSYHTNKECRVYRIYLNDEKRSNMATTAQHCTWKDKLFFRDCFKSLTHRDCTVEDTQFTEFCW